MKKLFTCIIIFITFNNSHAQLHGISPEWQNEIPIPEFNSQYSQRGVLYNNMEVSSSGRIYILTEEWNGASKAGAYITYSDDFGQSWATPLAFTPVNFTPDYDSPKLSIDSKDNLYLAWSSANNMAVYCSKLTANLQIIKDTVKVANCNAKPRALHLTIDKKDRLHIVWGEGEEKSVDTLEVFYSRSVNGGSSWSSSKMISLADGVASTFPRMQMGGASGDTIAIAWNHVLSGDAIYSHSVQMAVSTNGGNTWGIPFLAMYDTVITYIDPDLVVDKNGRIHLFSTVSLSNKQSKQIRYGWSDDLGLTWFPDTFMSISETAYESRLIEGSRYDAGNNVLWTFWKDERDYTSKYPAGDMMGSYSLNGGLSWSVPEFISDWDSIAIAYKAACLMPDGSVAVNYEVFNSMSNIRVYFRKRNNLITHIESENSLYNHGLIIYPNPAKDYIILQFSDNKALYVNSRICISNLMGQKIMAKKINDLSGTLTISLNGMSNGIYFIDFTDGREFIKDSFFIIN
jgi:hypothetical protein